MNLSQEIIEQVEQGVSTAKIASKYAWNDLSPVAQAELLEEVGQRDKTSANPLPLLRTLYVLTDKEDPWAAMRVLFVFYNTVEEKREDVLNSMRKKLEKIRDSLRREEAIQYLHYEAEYYVLKAHTEIDAGNLDGAIESYREALRSYKKALDEGGSSLSDRIALVEGDLRRLHAIRSRNQCLIPKDELESRHLRLQQEISRHADKLTEMRNDIEEKVVQRDKLRERCDKLKQEIEGYEEQERKLNLLTQQVRQHEAGLQFLMALPQAAMAPLWVEVVRLALEQGEIDSLVRQAVDRLAPRFPEEALPLLAEIVARTPGSLSMAPDRYRACTGHWMGRIAEARRLKEEEGTTAAAEILVEAWEAYFDALGDNVQ
ncbi:MAG: hypothetical protein JRG73_19600 [Deltaproteobacteria bacterium]|nr:hypothetical protein [Deltaproteobacteria bacterium]